MSVLDDTTKQKIINEHSDMLYDAIEDNFEDIRSTNEKIRDAADEQIDSLIDDIDDLKREKNGLTIEIEAIEDELYKKQQKCREWECQAEDWKVKYYRAYTNSSY